MIPFNWKGVLALLLIIVLCIAALFVVTAYAEEIEADYGYAVVEESGYPEDIVAINGTTGSKVITVYQMDKVYYGDVCDLRLVAGWYDKLIHKDTGRIVDISAYTHRIYIDPPTFLPGEWDQYSDFDFDEEQGNIVAFYVVPELRPALNLSELEEPEHAVILKPYIQPVEPRNVADFLVAHGDTLNVTVSKGTVWIFGKTEGYYDIPTVNDTFFLNASQVQYLTAGNYKLLVEQPGENYINVDMRYDAEKDRIEFFDPENFKISYLEMYGLDPRTRLDKFREIMTRTKDIYTEYDLVVAEPYVEIISLDFQYYKNQSASQTVRGYTNVAPDTRLTAIIDPDKHFGKDLEYSTFYGRAQGDINKPGDMRWFEMSLPLLFDNVGKGHHSITVSTDIGGSMNVDFDIYEAPEHSFIPNNTIMYANGSEWRPDPTPIIIEKIVTQEVVVTQTILVNVTPSQESVKQGQYDALVELVILIGKIVLVIVAVSAAIVYGWYLWVRRRERRAQR